MLKYKNYNKYKTTISLFKKILFTWIKNKIKIINCLELFSGSGILINYIFKIKINNLTLLERDKLRFYYLKNELKNYKNLKIINTCAIKYLIKESLLNFNLIIIDSYYKDIRSLFSVIKLIIFKNPKSFIYIETIFNLSIFFFYFNDKIKIFKKKTFNKVNIMLIKIN